MIAPCSGVEKARSVVASSALREDRQMSRSLTRLALLAAALSVTAVPARAQTSVNKTVPFELDKWYELNVKEGPITLHRIRLERQGSGGIKSRVRGANEYDTTVKCDLEFSNAATHDWKANFHVVWLDDSDEPIDGYTGASDLDEKKDFDHAGGSVTTLKYGLTKAKKMKIVIDIKPE
jgi:hypothetical protein